MVRHVGWKLLNGDHKMTFLKIPFLGAALVTFSVSGALAQSAVATDHSAHGAMAGSVDGAMAGYMESMDVMMASMLDMAATGDADADFLLMMIPHHQSAIDMAEVVLAQGDDPETLEMAQKIIDAQTGEVAEMRAMLTRLGVDAPE
jgi:uncharacterized protein (DUF305 family)